VSPATGHRPRWTGCHGRSIVIIHPTTQPYTPLHSSWSTAAPHRLCWPTHQGRRVPRPPTPCSVLEMRCWPKYASASCRPNSSPRSTTTPSIGRYSFRWATGCGCACCIALLSPSTQVRKGSWDLATPGLSVSKNGLVR
jgi:hypothetical protein